MFDVSPSLRRDGESLLFKRRWSPKDKKKWPSSFASYDLDGVFLKVPELAFWWDCVWGCGLTWFRVSYSLVSLVWEFICLIKFLAEELKLKFGILESYMWLIIGSGEKMGIAESLGDGKWEGGRGKGRGNIEGVQREETGGVATQSAEGEYGL
ncbi:hypothetical protein BC829DRAFT_416018 [Chytridium lagenaria]|nr:hypothetical protein BC829DRAFT_416018 [Chytridium lagenaria]